YKRHATGAETLAYQPRPLQQISHRMPWIAAAQRGRAHDERAVRNSAFQRFEFFRLREQPRRPHGRPRIPERQFERMHYPQVQKAEIAHRARRRANVQRIPSVHQNHAQSIEFRLSRQNQILYIRKRGAAEEPGSLSKWLLLASVSFVKVLKAVRATPDRNSSL